MKNVYCLSLDGTRTAYYGYVQPKPQSLVDYLRHFQCLNVVLEHYNASIGEGKVFLDKAGVLIDDEKQDGTEIPPKLMLKYNLKKALAARNRSIALSFLKRIDKVRYGSLWPE